MRLSVGGGRRQFLSVVVRAAVNSRNAPEGQRGARFRDERYVQPGSPDSSCLLSAPPSAVWTPQVQLAPKQGFQLHPNAHLEEAP